MAKPNKKVVRVEPTAKPGVDKPDGSGASSGPTWQPTAEAKGRAGTFRIIAAIMWALAIAGEIFTVFWVLKQSPVKMWLLIVMIVVIGLLAIGGSLLWKQANRADPASKQDTFRFFVQNQLGAIITVIAFLPMIFMIFLNKDMDGKQKGIAGGIAIAVAAIATIIGISFDPPSVEQYTEESNIMKQLTGQDKVFWVKSGEVFHVCKAVPDVNKESKDGQIYEGTVGAAHEAGKLRLVSYWDREAVNYCGYSQQQVDAVKGGSPAGTAPAGSTVPSLTASVAASG